MGGGGKKKQPGTSRGAGEMTERSTIAGELSGRKDKAVDPNPTSLSSSFQPDARVRAIFPLPSSSLIFWDSNLRQFYSFQYDPYFSFSDDRSWKGRGQRGIILLLLGSGLLVLARPINPFFFFFFFLFEFRCEEESSHHLACLHCF
jgi:hypothetical protein